MALHPPPGVEDEEPGVSQVGDHHIAELKESLNDITEKEAALQELASEIARLFEKATSMVEVDLGLSDDVTMPGLPGSNVDDGLRRLDKAVADEIKLIGDTLKEQVPVLLTFV